jgi:hypothetical protein
VSVILYVQPPVTSFTAAGVTITQTGVTVPDAKAAVVIAAAQAEDVPIFQGGTAADLELVGPIWYNPGTGAPSTGTWDAGQVVVDSQGAVFIRTASGSWAQPSGVGSLSVIDCGSSS